MNHGSTLYAIGVNYYSHGTINRGRKIEGYFFKLSKPATGEQFEAIKREFPMVQAGHTRSEYAPEQSASVLIFPSKAALKRLATI